MEHFWLKTAYFASAHFYDFAMDDDWQKYTRGILRIKNSNFWGIEIQYEFDTKIDKIGDMRIHCIHLWFTTSTAYNQIFDHQL